MKKQLAVGDVLWLVYNGWLRNQPREIVVSKVGRKWVYFDKMDSRFDAETWLVDGGRSGSPATIYESQDEYEKIVSLEKAWGRFSESVRNQYGHTPKGVTEEAIEQAAKLLNIWSEE